jgi:pyruvate dehydrogenase E1 component beta subunit
MAGRRPIVEFQIPTLLYVAFDQIVNQAQKIRLMTGGQTRVPVTYLFPGSGARLGLAGQHSDHPYSILAHLGVKTLVPATAEDAYSLMRASIDDDDPVALFLPAACLHRKSPVTMATGVLGTATVERAGSDVTLVATGHLVHDALALAEDLSAHVDIEVVNARSIFPFDWGLLEASVAKTGRLIAADDSSLTCGLSSEVVATAAERMHHLLKAPPVRVARAEATVPFSVDLERAIVPSKRHLRIALARLFPDAINPEDS